MELTSTNPLGWELLTCTFKSLAKVAEPTGYPLAAMFQTVLQHWLAHHMNLAMQDEQALCGGGGNMASNREAAESNNTGSIIPISTENTCTPILCDIALHHELELDWCPVVSCRQYESYLII